MTEQLLRRFHAVAAAVTVGLVVLQFVPRGSSSVSQVRSEVLRNAASN